MAGAQGRVWGWGWAGSHLPVEMQQGCEHRVITAVTVGEGKQDVSFWCDGKLYTGKAALKSKCNPAVTFHCESVYWKLRIELQKLLFLTSCSTFVILFDLQIQVALGCCPKMGYP